MNDHADSIAADSPTAWPRMRSVRWLVAVTGLVVLIGAAGIWWWFSQPNIGDAVREAGGRHRAEVMGPPGALAVLSSLINRQPMTVYHWIEFAPGQVDDQWLHAHRDQIGELPFVLLTLKNTHVTGDGLSAFAGMPNIYCVELTGTPLKHGDVVHLTSLPNLNQLFVDRTGLSGSEFAEMAQMPNLTTLGIDASQVTPATIAALQSYPRLVSLSVQDPDDPSVAEVARISGLIVLTLRGGNFTMTSIPALAQMPGLRTLILVDTPFTDVELQDLQSALPGCNVRTFDSEMRELMWRDESD